ncbi:hypothetical protein [Amantichitinum ursilacus]|uniref:Uncharacterized protein n=1 Tax=Amantichitinum ursilacus TaxID=857265 RepID=A0A0N0XL97_9NEIS|nr:hypothetical protein [Amantichitinum ursilacus]KPC55015.1 hypothetical protein WG78_00110 [Amantichitinum ursilacus]
MSTAAVTFSEAAVREVAELAANHAECIVYQVDRAVDVELITDRFICHCYIEPGLQLRPPRHTSFGSPIRGFRRRGSGYAARFQFFHMQRAYRWTTCRYSGIAQVSFSEQRLAGVRVIAVKHQRNVQK